MKKLILVFSIFTISVIISYLVLTKTLINSKYTNTIRKNEPGTESVNTTTAINNPENSENDLVARKQGILINFRFLDFKYDNANNILSGSIEIKNNDQLDFINLSYTYILRRGDISKDTYIKLPVTKVDLIEVKNTTNVFNIPSNKIKIVTLNYELPKNLNAGKYYLEFQITNEEGRAIVNDAFPFEINETVGKGMPILIMDSYVEKDGEKKSHNSGPNYLQTESIGKLITTFKNPTTSVITVYPTYKIYEFSEKGKLVGEIKEKPIILAGNEDYRLESTLSPLDKPNAYKINLHLYDKDNIDQSIVVDYRAIIRGSHAGFYYMKSSDPTFSSEKNEFFYYFFGPYDGKVITNAVLKTSLYDNTKLIEETETLGIDLRAVARPVPIIVKYKKHDILQPVIKISVHDKDQNILYNNITIINNDD